MSTRRLSELLERFLKKIFSTRVVFDDGSYIEYLNREALMYVEKDGRRMEIMWFFKSGYTKTRVLHKKHIDHWDPPNEKDTLSSAKKEDIERKIAEYCVRHRIPLELV